ncbi:alpha/beta hydrolase [Granulicella cerasi]|uniref:alpha/beta hydrolase n=1 Tax=Granulicella cerasi TaxID=741063 RepID=UPI0021DF8D93|nr:alpha/beta hydrolase-fold protein [Granulicella cerasi]
MEIVPTPTSVRLPFDGAPLDATPSLDHPTYPEERELDANPRYRILRDFESRYLPDARDIRIYLPEAYLSEPTRRFPVFYLHDGQNLFDGRLSYVAGKTWQANSTADRLTREGRIEPVILVGLDNTGTHRMADYTPTRDKEYGGGEGPLYGRLLVDELKPLIDSALRTLPDAANTGLGGSSLGGLISLFLGLQHPTVFGKLAVLSPSVWWDNRALLNSVGAPKRTILSRFQSLPAPPPAAPRARIWLDMGMAEGLRHLRDCDLLAKRLVTRGWKPGQDLEYLRVPGGLHNEEAWAARFDQVLEFLFPGAL